MSSTTSNKLSFAAIVVLACNTMNGPGLTTLCSVANAAGTTLYILLVMLAAFVTSFVLKRLCDLLWRTQKPASQGMHNHNLQHNMDLVAFSEKIFHQTKIAAICMTFCALSLALAQMMLCAAIADSMMVAAFGKSCGVGLVPPFGIHCTSAVSMKPFFGMEEIPVSLLSQGLVISSFITISLASVDLDAMLPAQYVLFACLILACCRFCYTLHKMGSNIDTTNVFGETSPSPIFGSSPFDAVGPILFNFAFVVTAPPLSNGAESLVGATRALVTSVVVMACLYIVVGAIGATAARDNNNSGDDNLLSLVLRGASTSPENPPQGMDILAVILFGLSQLAAIPVYCELARETLQTHLRINNRRVAFVASHVLPWIVVALTYNSALFEAFVEWSSLLLLGFANFSLPLLLDHHALASEHKLHTPGSGPDAVLWGLCVITASIAAVIVQRMTGSILLAEVIFMATTLLILKYERDPTPT